MCVCVSVLQTGRLSLDNGESEGSGLLLLLVFWLSARQTEGESLIVWHRGRRRETRDEQFLVAWTERGGKERERRREAGGRIGN